MHNYAPCGIDEGAEQSVTQIHTAKPGSRALAIDPQLPSCADVGWY